MRTLSKTILVLGLVALLASPALAQRPQFGGGGFGRGSSLSSLLQNKSVQEEIKLDADQVTKATEAFKKFGEENGDNFRKLFNPQTTAEERAEISKKMAEGGEKIAKDVLKPEQMARVKQIQLQIEKRLEAFKDEAVLGALKLNDEQKKDIETLAADVSKTRDEIFREAGRDQAKQEEARKKATAISVEAGEKVQKLLTADQKKAWETLVGKPFEMKFEPRRPNNN